LTGRFRHLYREEMARPSIWIAMGVMLAACSSGSSDDDGTSTRPRTLGDAGEDPVERPKVPCTMQADPTLSYEEQRLSSRLPGKTVTFASEILQGTAFDGFESAFSTELCKDGLSGASTFEDAKVLASGAGKRLWRAAVDRVQGRRTGGSLPAGDDRMLYWARLTMTKTLRAWQPQFPLSQEERVALENELERASRGQTDITFAAGDVVRVLVSGFDPFTLGKPGSTDDPDVRIGNPSGAAMLAFDGVDVRLANGKTAHIETYLLPVNYGPFERGMQEDVLAPFFKEGPTRLDVAVTMSQGSGYEFKLEEWNGRYHGEFEGNDNIATCKVASGLPLASTPGCNIIPPERYTGYSAMPWRREQPPQFTQSSLPVARIIEAQTGTRVTRPPGSLASAGNAFDVIWGTDFTAFTSCSSTSTVSYNDPPYDTYPPPEAPTPPPSTACARSGGGGDYLSNESAYRATLLRDVIGVPIFVGHVHMPVMTRFETGHDDYVTDPKFEAYRAAIVSQAKLILEAIAAAR
jgi:hypothetical protein